jgi:hypothetical protein
VCDTSSANGQGGNIALNLSSNGAQAVLDHIDENIERTADFYQSLVRQPNDTHKNHCSPGRNTNLFDTDEMLRRLRNFQTTYNHTSVPPDWKHDVVLADWCTVQRQLYRQVQRGYGCQQHDKVTALLRTLQGMDFCWDYDEWHWNYWYDRLMPNRMEPLPESISVWLHKQQKQYQNGNNMSRDRSEKLKQAGCLSP